MQFIRRSLPLLTFQCDEIPVSPILKWKLGNGPRVMVLTFDNKRNVGKNDLDTWALPASVRMARAPLGHHPKSCQSTEPQLRPNVAKWCVKNPWWSRKQPTKVVDFWEDDGFERRFLLRSLEKITTLEVDIRPLTPTSDRRYVLILCRSIPVETVVKIREDVWEDQKNASHQVILGHGLVIMSSPACCRVFQKWCNP